MEATNQTPVSPSANPTPAAAATAASKSESLKDFFKRVPTTVKVAMVGIALGIVLVVGLSFFAIYKLLTLNSEPDLPAAVLTQHQQHHDGPAPSFENNYEIKEISVHFASSETEKVGYAQFGVAFDMKNGEGVRTMELNRARVLDLIFEVAADFSLEEMKTPEGYAGFKSALLKKFNQSFAGNGPREVAIKNWLLN